MSKKNRILITVLLFTLPVLMMSVNNEYSGRNGGTYISLVPFQPKILGDFWRNENQMPHKIDLTMETGDENPHLFDISTESNSFYMPENGLTYSNDEKEAIQEKPIIVVIEIVPELMKFDKDVFTVTSGKKVVLEIDNRDGMQHNLLIVKPGTLQKVGAAADAMLRDPKASEKQYVPEIPEVLFSTKMLEPNEVFTLSFTAPSQPGDYPFVCTFPGHWRMMNGIMRVVKP
jgi:azurin